MIYDIRLNISYAYDSPAVGGRQVVCVMPLDLPGQRVLRSDLVIDPQPEERLDRRDFFGNQISEFAFRGPHDHIGFLMTARVKRLLDGSIAAGGGGLKDLHRELTLHRDLGGGSPLHHLAASFRVPRDAGMTAFARSVVSADMTVAQAVVAVGHALHGHMQFDPAATTVDTPAQDAFASRHGVCQDFSHIMISCLRGLGIPAGYVSGFLRTLPPPGKPRLEGADAMHAWVRAWCGAAVGWVEFDPTNDKTAGPDHIVVALGRDYSDVAPIKGSLRISGGQRSRQAVDVVPV